MSEGCGDSFATLMQRLREGSQDAAWELVERYAPHIRRAVRRTLTERLRSKFDSHDFIQAVWSSFFRHRSEIVQAQTSEQLVAFLGAMARNKIIDEIRRFGGPRRDVSLECSFEETTTQGAVGRRQPRPSEVAIAREQWSRLLSGQSDRDQQIIRLRFRGETCQAIAEHMHLNERTIRRVLTRLLEERVA